MRPLALASFAVLIACSGKKTAEPVSKPPEAPIVYSSNGWSDAERAEFYHLPEGSELMPYALLANLMSVKTGKPFLEDMERFGFLPDNAGPSNPYGMPIGLTVSQSRNTLAKGRRMVGFNCAACHTAQIAYRGKRLRIDGAPALIDANKIEREVADGMAEELARVAGDPNSVFFYSFIQARARAW